MDVKPQTVPQTHRAFQKKQKFEIFLELQILDQLIKYRNKDVKH